MDEELYDSLEDEIKSLSDISLHSDKEVTQKIQTNQYHLCDFIPFFDGEILKDNVKNVERRKCKKFSKIPVLSNGRKNKPITVINDSNGIKNQPKQSKNKPELVRVKEQNTYLKLFHAKIGYPKGNCIKAPQDTTRGTVGDSTYRTATSDLSQNTDSKTPHSVTDSETKYFTNVMFDSFNLLIIIYFSFNFSFYIKHIKNDTVVPPLNLSDRNSCIFLRSINGSTVNNFKSVTCQNLPKHTTSRKYSKYTISIPKLGGLGPDMESTKEKVYRFDYINICN